MARKTNYKFEKRQRELQKAAKKAAKREAKLAEKDQGAGPNNQPKRQEEPNN